MRQAPVCRTPLPATHRAALAVLLLVTVLAAALGLVEVGGWRDPAAAVSAGAHAPCRVPAPTTAAGYARAMDALPQGGDATLSVRLRSGRTAWIFADSLGPHLGFVHSTVVVQERGCFVPSGRSLLPDDRDATFWWPSAAVTLPDGAVLVTASDGYGNRTRAAICIETRAGLRFDHWLPGWPQGRGARPVRWNAGLLVDGDVLRVYGIRPTGARWQFDRELWTASVPLRHVADGRGWRLASHPVAPAETLGVDNTVAPFRDRRGYHLVTLQGGPFGTGPLVRLDAPTADGPFTRTVLVARAPANPGQWRYNAAVHPGAGLRDGRLLVTLNNNWPIGDVTPHPLWTYRPRFLTVGRP